MAGRAVTGNGGRLGVAVAAYAVLGLLIWMTMSDVPIRIGGGKISIRGLTLAVVAFFAVRTFLHWKAGQARPADEESEVSS